LQRREDLRASAAWARIRAVVEKVFGIDFAQPFQGERWPGSVAHQGLTAGAVGGLDAHRGIDGKATTVLRSPARQRLAAGRGARRRAASASVRARHGGAGYC